MVLKKSQRVVSFLLTLTMLLALSSFFCIERVYAAYDGEWNYEVEGNGATITGYTGIDKSITVPSKVGGYQVLKVSGLCNSKQKTKITAVTFSNGVRTLSDGLLKGYSSLERVTLPNTLTTIGANAFADCIALKAITVPNTVTSIGMSAFSGCHSLISVTMNCKAKSIPTKLFAGDSSLTTITLPTYTTEIGENAFEGCSALTSLALPDTVTSIGKGAFTSCTRLSNISLSRDLTTINELAFYNCTSLTSIFIPNKTKKIYEEAFYGCSSLKTVYIGSSVNVMKTNIFKSCSSLETLVFGGDYYDFALFSKASFTATIYYPSKYASNWSSLKTGKPVSYQAPTSVTITGGKNIKAGDKISLTVKVSPSSSKFGDIYSITSSDPTVAAVSVDGTVIARATGVTTITVTTLNGISKSIDISVTPAAPANLKATPKTTTSAVLTWKAVSSVSGYNIYRSTTKTGTYKKVGSSTSATYTDKGLTKGKTYYYKVVSYVNSQGKQLLSSYSSVVSLTASAPAPATITATKVKSGSAKITWGKSTGASGYEVYMATSSSGSYTKIATISQVSTLSYTKSSLTKGKTYYFKVRSYTTVDGKKIYSNYTKVVKVKV